VPGSLHGHKTGNFEYNDSASKVLARAFSDKDKEKVTLPKSRFCFIVFCFK
jgi:hypothetical protein